MRVEMDTCPSCGALVEGGAEGCQRLFDQFSASLYAAPGLAYTVRRMAVDCYCLQHPSSYCLSAKSLAAHLTGLCWALEFDGSERGLKTLQSWLNGQVPLVKPAIPPSRGPLTVRDLIADPGPPGPAVDRWGRATWAAYADLHATARRWVEEASGRGARS